MIGLYITVLNESCASSLPSCVLQAAVWQASVLRGSPDMTAASLRWAFPVLALRSLRHNVLESRRRRVRQ